jgi:hypothetical protein
MKRENLISRRCAHLYPLTVISHKGGKHARCLGCGVRMEALDPKIPAHLRI